MATALAGEMGEIPPRTLATLGASSREIGLAASLGLALFVLPGPKLNALPGARATGADMEVAPAELPDTKRGGFSAVPLIGELVLSAGPTSRRT